MVSSINSTSASATQATYAPAARKSLDETVATASPVTATADQDAAPAPTQSAESAASARLGDQLNAQADASRVQRAVDEASTDSAAATETDTDASTGTDTEAAAAAAPARSAPPAGGAPAASSGETSTATDYIAEADTNSDKTVSDEERAAYETKLRKQAEDSAASNASSSTQADPIGALTAEVRATYGVDEVAEPALNITA